MKEYLRPTIARVRLDRRSALLNVCQQGGVYYDSLLRHCAGLATGVTDAACETRVKGRSIPTTEATAETQTMPS